MEYKFLLGYNITYSFLFQNRQLEEEIRGSFMVKSSFKCLTGFCIRLCLSRFVESVRIRSFSGPYFPVFGLNMEIYRVSFRIMSKCGKIRTRKTLNTDNFHAVSTNIIRDFAHFCLFSNTVE